MERVVIDRFEGPYAVLLTEAPQAVINIPRSELPVEAREGLWLRVEVVDGRLVRVEIDDEATAEAQRRIQEKLARLRRGDHLKDDAKRLPE